MFTISEKLLRADGTPGPTLLLALLKKQEDLCAERLNRLFDVYDGQHRIDGRLRLKYLPNNRLAHDFPGYIVAMTSGYLVGEPVKYTLDEKTETFERLKDALERSDTASVDAELAVDAAVYGKGVELCYADEQARPMVAQVDPRRSFVVYDDTVAHKPLFGVACSDVLDGNLKKSKELVIIYTAKESVRMERTGAEAPVEIRRDAHYFGAVPMIEYWNNAREKGDFERVLSLIDAYDSLQSDRLNDKQQFTDAIMVLKGVGALGTDEAAAETTETDAEADADAPAEPELTPSERLRQTRTLFLPGEGADAGFITKPDAESGNELLRQSLSDDVHKFSFVPDLTDEKFSGDTSGVAMRFKLFGLEQLTKIKERWFKEALRARLACLANFLQVKGAGMLDVEAIQISFSRSLPVNNLELSQVVSNFQGKVPDEMLLSLIPWIDDPKRALAMLQKQKDAEMKRQQATFARFDAEKPPQTEQSGGEA